MEMPALRFAFGVGGDEKTVNGLSMQAGFDIENTRPTEDRNHTLDDMNICRSRRGYRQTGSSIYPN